MLPYLCYSGLDESDINDCKLHMTTTTTTTITRYYYFKGVGGLKQIPQKNSKPFLSLDVSVISCNAKLQQTVSQHFSSTIDTDQLH
jgi:hypothetical protein